MVQTSITSWLKKPGPAASVAKPVESTPAPAAPTPTNSTDASTHQNVKPQLEIGSAVDNSIATKTDENLPAPITFKHALPPLPSNVQLVPLTEELMPGFQRLTALTLPISYPPAFFAESMTEPVHGITLMALWQTKPLAPGPTPNPDKPRVVGAIRCRLLPSSTLYISTISLLAPYRSHGIASHLLQHIVVQASKAHGIRSVTAHVWEANEDGLEWYEKRGFEIIGKEEKYYNKLKPAGAVLVRKWVGVSDLLASTGMPGAATS